MTHSERVRDSDQDQKTCLTNSLPEEAFISPSNTGSAIFQDSDTSKILTRYLQHIGSCKHKKKRRCISQELEQM
jgi:hypothetical protein